ncbi:restriction endonuclease subunit S [Laspinema olomoucense]|uniref:restriction endonuclease subunit S n=1 Tax=Laspinema olomoucense TaxID=3231600 RepID=UPI0021BB3235|nr:restriction endonuclease subunit S [Laspinema sp. D3a]MCT7988685.1 restriction endonuclease subunit S [Laspinema sp. D3a]
MATWKKVRVGDFLFEREGRYKPNSQEIAELPRIDKIDFSGNFHIANKPSKTDMILIKTGDLVISGINVAKGALGVYHGQEDVTATIHYSSYTFDESVISVEYFKRFLKSPLFIQLLKEQVKGGIKTEIKPKHLLSLEIMLPEKQEQLVILKRFQCIENEHKELKSELTHQQTLLKKLRQQILQEAIEGKLTADWRSQNPDVEPASKLLKRIAIEKAQLVKAKKIKPQKPLPPITDEEKPFELPKGWEWCRLGDYAFFERGKFSIRPRNDPTCFGGEYPFIQIGSLNESGSLINDFKQTLNEKGFAASKLFEKGTIAVAIVGGTIGNLGILGCDMCFPDSMVGVRPNPMKNQKFIWALLRYFYPVIKKAAYQMAGQPNIKLPTLNNLVCALPPREEQAAMLSKIDKLLALCDQLESQITQNKTHAEQLMQAVLKEAFSHNSESKG